MNRNTRYPYRKRTLSQSGIECQPTTTGNVLSGPFKATEFIENVSIYLEKLCNTTVDNRNVSSGALDNKSFDQRRMRSASAVFATNQLLSSKENNVMCGSSIVEHLYNYITVECPFKDVSRDNAEKLASTLIKFKVLIPVQGKVEEKNKFFASKNHLYKVVPKQNARHSPNYFQKRRQSISQFSFRDRDMLQPLNTTPKRMKLSQSNITKLKKLPHSIPGFSKFHQCYLVNTMIETYNDRQRVILRHIALTKLLQIIELPLLTDIIGYIENELCQADYKSSNPFYSHCEDDFCNALLELCSILNIRPILCHQKRPPASYKLELTQLLFDNYETRRSTIIDHRFNPILICIKDLLKSFQDRKAKLAMQLLSLLLPIRDQQHLKSMLSFIKLVENENSINLKGSDCRSNLEFIINAFTTVVFEIDDGLSKADGRFILQYIVKQRDCIGAIPSNINTEVGVRMRVFHNDSSYSPTTFCVQISKEDYERQKSDVQQHDPLKKLLEFVIACDSMNIKQKKSFVRKVEKYHVGIYERVFQHK